MKILSFLNAYLTLGLIVGALPNNIQNGQVEDAVPVMANYNWIVNQVNANAAQLTLTPQLAVANTFTAPQSGVQGYSSSNFPQQGMLRSYLAGCVMSPAGGSGTMPIAAGCGMDSTNNSVMILAAINKTTAAWAVGTNLGGLDTGAIAINTWYKFFLIQRTDTGVVDVTFTIAALATGPAMPAGYSLFRYIGSAKTDGSSQWIKFAQNGDVFEWVTTVSDFSATAPGTTAVSKTLTVPTGVVVRAILNAHLQCGAVIPNLYLSSLAQTDEVPTAVISTLTLAFANDFASCYVEVTTNASAQIRTRASASDANVQINGQTLGWIDRRGRDS